MSNPQNCDVMHLGLFVFFKDLIHILERENEHRQREKQEPDTELDPRTPGSQPELKADVSCTGPPAGTPICIFLSHGVCGNLLWRKQDTSPETVLQVCIMGVLSVGLFTNV